ncbi:hypothetical protein GORHZ_184_00070 [Gordonia rhizosphera NBRC 16068]|uniref:Uncharacterized protein n=2 Tax=Gordonia rhizosphera TaxID=83341 RepID=K6V8M3_9ACTN|nr:hypothetical protein GORHZ_184_00070 [Gordonia rhizosphera NBRC 16068]
MELPTLTSIEAIIGRISALGFILADQNQIRSIANLVNTSYITVPEREWEYSVLNLRAQRANQDEGNGLRAVQTLRTSTVSAAEKIERVSGNENLHLRRKYEDDYVGAVKECVLENSNPWRKHGTMMARLVGRTVLSSLTENLIGIPLADLISQSLSGFGRRV